MQELKKLGIFTLLAVACLTIMVGCVIVPGLNSVSEHLGMDNSASWMITIPSLGVFLLGPLAGKFIDRTGPWNALAFGLFFYGVLGTGAIFLHGPVAVLTDRFLLGGVTGIVMSAGTGLITMYYSGDTRLNMIAKQGMSIELGGVIFLFASGILATLGWRWPFALYLISWVFLGMLVMSVPRHVRGAQDTEISDDETGMSHALRPVLFTATFSMICFFASIIIIPRLFNEIGVGSAKTGYFLSFISLVAVAAASVMPNIVARLHEYGTLYLAFSMYALAHMFFALSSCIAMFVVGGVFMGIGFGLSIPLVNHMTIELSHARVRGRNLAYLSMSLFAGQFLSSFLALIPGSTSGVFIVAAVIGMLVILSLILYRNKHRH